MLVNTAPDCPPELAYLLTWWAELSCTRGASMAGALPISFREIESWMRLSGRRVSAREVALLRKIDDAFLRSLSDG